MGCDISRRGRHAASALLLACALVCGIGQLDAQQRQSGSSPPPLEVAADGTELFRALLDRAGIKPLARDDVDLGRLDRYDGILVIVLGTSRDRAFGEKRTIDYVHSVVNNGGAALVATDQAFHLGYARNARGQDDWAVVEPVRVWARDPRVIHGGKEYCPYVVPRPAAGGGPVSPVQRLFEGLNRVATNEPACLRVRGLSGEWRFGLARFPFEAFAVDPFGGQPPRRLPPDAWFAVGGDGPDGTSNNSGYQFVAMADHSVFINQMLLEPGTDNLELAYRVIDYLQGPGRRPGEKRKQCIFIENGVWVGRFDDLRRALAVPKPPLPAPNLGAVQDKLLDWADAVAEEVQQRDLLNSLLLRAFGLPSIMRFLFVTAAACAGVYLLRRAFGYRQPTDLPPPPKVPAAADGPPGVFTRRERELLLRNNVYEPVRDRLRDFFSSLGFDGSNRPEPPPVWVSPQVRRPAVLRRAVEEFWQLAYGPPGPLSVYIWQEMERYFDRLCQAHSEGKWRFQPHDLPPESLATSASHRATIAGR